MTSMVVEECLGMVVACSTLHLPKVTSLNLEVVVEEVVQAKEVEKLRP